MNNVISTDTSQVIAFPLPSSLIGKQNQEGTQKSLDPTGERVLSSALQLLETKSKVTVREVCDEVGIQDKACRKRLRTIVQLNKLYYEPGAGRIPSYYSLPKDTFDGDVDRPDSTFVEQLLSVIQNEKEIVLEKIAKLKGRLDELAHDEEQAKAVMAMGEKYLGTQGDREGY